jgi:serine/threonine-protein kinase
MKRLLLLALAACGGSDGGGGGPYFTSKMFFDRDVSGEPKAALSDQFIGSLRAAGGWGNSDRFSIDFSFDVLTADGSTPARAFTPTADFVSPDCDMALVPVPATGNVEGETGYACTQGGDCHLIVFDENAGKLYEMYRANITTTFSGGCLAVWDTHAQYGDTLRGDQCTSADAAGLPIAPMLLSADEVAAGAIHHALRFTLPNDRIRTGFVRPATHGTSTTGLPGAPYYGVHLRLRADYPVDSLPSTGAKVVARALQAYGMVQADGGEITLTAQTDRYSAAKWPGLLASQDLQALAVEDFEVIDHGPAISLTNECTR